MELLHYRTYGEGPAIVLLHGFCESASIFKHFLPSLTAHGRVITIDLGGFGQSADRLPRPVTMDTMAQQVAAVLDHLSIEKAIFIGHSLGGYVSLAFADLYPSRVRGLCLFHSTALADSEEKKRTRNKVIEFVKKVGVPVFIESFVPPLFYEGRREELSEYIEVLKAEAAQTPLTSVVAVTEAMRDRPARLHVLEKADYPVCFIIGKNDAAVPLESYMEQIVLPRQCTAHFLGETGHMGMFERPQECLQFLVAFIGQCI